MKKNIFMYGSLKSGYSRSDILKGQEFLGEVRTEKKFRLFHLGSFPGMVVDDNGLSIKGELWSVDEGLIELLDRIEGHPTFYCRTPIKLSDGQEVESYLLVGYGTDGFLDVGEEWTHDAVRKANQRRGEERTAAS